MDFFPFGPECHPRTKLQTAVVHSLIYEAVFHHNAFRNCQADMSTMQGIISLIRETQSPLQFKATAVKKHSANKHHAPFWDKPGGAEKNSITY